MTRFAVLALLCLACLVTVSTASAKSSYTWPSSEKWAFTDNWSDWAELRGYRWPNLYADCLQKATAKMYPSYSSFLNVGSRDSFRRWSNSAGMGHCVTAYGQKWWD